VCLCVRVCVRVRACVREGYVTNYMLQVQVVVLDKRVRKITKKKTVSFVTTVYPHVTTRLS